MSVLDMLLSLESLSLLDERIQECSTPSRQRCGYRSSWWRDLNDQVPFAPGESCSSHGRGPWRRSVDKLTPLALPRARRWLSWLWGLSPIMGGPLEGNSGPLIRFETYSSGQRSSFVSLFSLIHVARSISSSIVTEQSHRPPYLSQLRNITRML